MPQGPVRGLRMSSDHKPERKDEWERVVRDGAKASYTEVALQSQQ